MYHLKYLTIMSLNYSIAMMGNPLKKEEPKKAYAKAQTNGELSLKELSTLIASKCTVHQADVSAVLIATTECMLEGLKAGKPKIPRSLVTICINLNVVKQFRSILYLVNQYRRLISLQKHFGVPFGKCPNGWVIQRYNFPLLFCHTA